MDPSDWIVFSCRACRSMIKVPVAMAGNQVICPSCRTKVHVPDRAPLPLMDLDSESSSTTSLPVARETDSKMRGLGRESWERGGKSIGTPLDFKEKLLSTEAPSVQFDPEDESQQLRRVNLKKMKNEALKEDFDDPEVQHRKRRTKVRSKGGAFAKTLVKGLIICIILLVSIIAYLLYKKVDFFSQGTAKAKYIPPVRDLERMAIGEYLPQIKKLAHQFLKAPNVDAMIKVVRDPERVGSKIREFYTNENSWHPFDYREIIDNPDEIVTEGNFLVLPIQMVNYDTIILSIEKTPKGYLVDWESFVGWGEIPWNRFMKERPETPVVMRVIMKKSLGVDFYTKPFEENDWHCYQLTDQKTDYVLSGYVKKDSALEIQIAQAIIDPARPKATTQQIHAVVRLQYPPNPTNQLQVEIVEFLEKGWVFREDSSSKTVKPVSYPPIEKK